MSLATSSCARKSDTIAVLAWWISAVCQPCRRDHSSLKPSRLNPSAGFDLLSIHSNQSRTSSFRQRMCTAAAKWPTSSALEVLLTSKVRWTLLRRSESSWAAVNGQTALEAPLCSRAVPCQVCTQSSLISAPATTLASWQQSKQSLAFLQLRALLGARRGRTKMRNCKPNIKGASSSKSLRSVAYCLLFNGATPNRPTRPNVLLAHQPAIPRNWEASAGVKSRPRERRWTKESEGNRHADALDR